MDPDTQNTRTGPYGFGEAGALSVGQIKVFLRPELYGQRITEDSKLAQNLRKSNLLRGRRLSGSGAALRKA
jgi:hypothetical protein